MRNTSFKATTIGDVYDQFLEAYKWIKGLGIIGDGSRFEESDKLFSALAASYRAGKLSEVLNDQNAYLYSSIINDCLELYQIYLGLSQIEQKFYLKELVEYATGPTFPSDENMSDTNRPRNSGFELTTLSLFVRAGFKDLRKTDADVSIRINDIEYFIECKRPQTEASVDANVRKAISQLKIRIGDKTNEDRRAIFGISMNKVINPSKGLVTVRSLEDLDQRMKGLSNWFWKKHQHRWHKVKDQRLVAGIMHINSVVMVTDPSMLTTAEWALMLSINNTGTPDQEEIRAIGAELNEVIKP